MSLLPAIRYCSYPGCTVRLLKRQKKYCSHKHANFFIGRQPERIQKYIVKATGLKRSKEHCERARQRNLGKVIPQETRDKISKSLMGRVVPEEEKIKMRQNSARYWLGKHLPKEMVQKTREKKLGTKRSEEAKRKTSETLLRLYKEGKMGRNSCGHSRTEKLWGNLIRFIFEVDLESNFPLGGKFYDFKYKDMLFEIDGSYWHSLPTAKINDVNKWHIAVNNDLDLFRFSGIDTTEDVIKNIETDFLYFVNIFGEPKYHGTVRAAYNSLTESLTSSSGVS